MPDPLLRLDQVSADLDDGIRRDVANLLGLEIERGLVLADELSVLQAASA